MTNFEQFCNSWTFVLISQQLPPPLSFWIPLGCLVDFSRLVSIVELINSTSVDLSLHLWAIVTDQLSAEKLREQLFMQRKMTYLGEMTKNGKPQPDLKGTDKSDPCFIEQI